MSGQMELPEQIGPYRVLGLLGEGGSGRVYRAEETAPRREVALKVLRESQAAASFQARFQREIALMGALEHPGIARLYAAGTAATPSGPLPYLAMEYVRGTDLLDYCQHQALPIAARLRLLAAVCEAVHYAHTRGIVHRDLKPGNVLVDARGAAKVLDFGIAQVTTDGNATQVTRIGEVLGTLPYMSWEQLAGEPGALDPRADVFALGVIGYQLLSGQLPFAGGRNTTLMQALKERQEKTPLPLARVLPLAHGDLDTIVMKAMAHEAAARYGSAAELAADLQRYLDRRPIEARPPTASYVVRLFVRRHKALAAGAALAVLALLLGAGVSLHYGLSEAAARHDAEQRLAERDAVSRFLENMFIAADPERALGSKLTVRDVLDVARRELDSQRATLSPGVLAQLQGTLGNTYTSLGQPAQALPLLEAAERAAVETTGAGSLAARRARLDTLRGLIRAGRQAEAAPRLRALVAEPVGKEPGALALHLAAVTELADHEIYTGSPREAEQLASAALPSAREGLGADDPVTLMLGYERALALQMDARYDESIAQAMETIAGMERRFGAQHPRTQLARDALALSYREQGKFAEAEAIYRATVAAREQVLGPTHPQTAAVRVSLAAVLSLAGRNAEALPLARQAHADILKVLDPEAETARSVTSLRAYVESENGEIAISAELNRGLIAQTEAKPGGPSENDLPDYNNLANQLMKLDHKIEARALYERLLAHAERLVGRDHAHYGMFENNYGECLRQLGELSAARTALLHSRGVLEKQLEPEHPHRKRVVERLAQVEAALAAQKPR
ncbi:MAG: serine/threonine-protein kinase [Stagnimonas sp.]|nr:serine/threonine-protein kinase [Stagnimonas sp.]